MHILASLVLSAAAAPSTMPGMGALPYSGGVAFRVWVPHADAVSVTGDFDGWDPLAHPLSAEPGGLWSADVPGAAVGDRYRYTLRNGAQELSRRDPRARQVTTSDYATGHSVVYDPDAFAWGADAPVRPAPADLVIYQLHVGSFSGGVAPGTLDDAIAGLDHVVALGATAVELLPVAEFPGTVALGYAPSDPFAVEQVGYGGPDALKRFVRAAHARGLAVFGDVVFNHFGPLDLHLHRFDGWSTGDYTGGIYFWDAARGSSPWGPRPNYADPDVRSFLFDNLRMWVTEYRLDGLRWDSTSNIYDTWEGTGTYLPEGASLLTTSNQAFDALLPGFMSIAEDLKGEPRLTDAVASGGAGFDSQWDGFGWDVRRELTRSSDALRDLGQLQAALERSYNGDPMQRTIFTETHDLASAAGGGRLPTEVAPGDPEGWAARRGAALGAVFLLTAPGIPLVFQGQELLETRAFDPGTTMDWSRVTSQAGTLALWRDLIALRRNLGGVSGGLRGVGLSVHHVDASVPLLGWHRWDAGSDDVVILANLGSGPALGQRVGFPTAGTWVTRFNGDDLAYGADHTGVGSTSVVAGGPPADGMPFSALVDVAPYAGLVLSRGP